MGDLNYRIDYGDQGPTETPPDATFKDMMTLIEEEKFDELFKCDQVCQCSFAIILPS